MRTVRPDARIILLVALCFIGGWIGSLVTSPLPSPAGGGLVYSAGQTVYGATTGEWSARHWQWTLSLPIGENPGQDATGVRCATGQTAQIFFIPRNFPSCEVPAGTLLFVPIAGTECSTAEFPPYHGETESELRACASADVDRYTGISVRIDGELVPDIGAYRASSPIFSLTLPENNVLGVSPGSASAVADGYQFLLAPLPPGEHEIMVHVELQDGTVLPDKIMRFTVVESS